MVSENEKVISEMRRLKIINFKKILLSSDDERIWQEVGNNAYRFYIDCLFLGRAFDLGYYVYVLW